MTELTPDGASLPGGFPDSFDPERDHLLTPRRLRGLLHPIRVRLLNLLESDGPATASQLGRRIGESSGLTSYHLRILAEHGFIEDDQERSNGRDRVWKPRYRGTAFTFRSPDDPADREGVELGAQYIRLLVDDYHARMVRFLSGLSGRVDDLAEMPWTFNDSRIALTHDQARALAAQVRELVDRYRHDPATDEQPVGAERAYFMFQMLPDDEAQP